MEEKVDLNLIELHERKIDTLKKLPTEKQANPGLIDKNKASGFMKADIYNIADLVRFFPKRYIQRELITSIQDVNSDDDGNEINWFDDLKFEFYNKTIPYLYSYYRYI